MKIHIPYNFDPRGYQRSPLEALDSGIKRGVAVWHRRAGKDLTFLNITIKKAFERVGNYYYYFPTSALGRKVLWQGKKKDGRPFLEHIPPEVRSKTREDEMRIELINGSAIQIMGTDRTDVVGPNPAGCVFSEYSLQDPSAWNYIRPILVENEGWAMFNFTPRGRNHAHQLYEMAKHNPKWYCELLTVDDTGVISKEDIQDEIDAGMSEALVQQEFYCSFDYGLEGAYYLKQLANARQDGRITKLPWQSVPVHTAWDLGFRDATTIWFYQLVGKEVWFIDYYENSGEELAHYAKVLQDKDYLYGQHWAPHDIRKHEMSYGNTLYERARELGIRFDVIENWQRTGIGLSDGIEMVRSMFPRYYFREEKTRMGINALNNYQKKWDEKWQQYKDTPQENWATHGADAFRIATLAINKTTRTGTMTEQEIYELYEQYAPPV